MKSLTFTCRTYFYSASFLLLINILFSLQNSVFVWSILFYYICLVFCVPVILIIYTETPHLLLYIHNCPLLCTTSITYAPTVLVPHHPFFPTSELDECNSMPCQNGGQCLDEINGFRCICETGWTGVTCEMGKFRESFHDCA